MQAACSGALLLALSSLVTCPVCRLSMRQRLQHPAQWLAPPERLQVQQEAGRAREAAPSGARCTCWCCASCRRRRCVCWTRRTSRPRMWTPSTAPITTGALHRLAGPPCWAALLGCLAGLPGSPNKACWEALLGLWAVGQAWRAGYLDECRRRSVEDRGGELGLSRLKLLCQAGAGSSAAAARCGACAAASSIEKQGLISTPSLALLQPPAPGGAAGGD